MFRPGHSMPVGEVLAARAPVADEPRGMGQLRRPPAPRAIVGGLLMTVAAIGTFLVWSHSTHPDQAHYVVAARPLLPGEQLGADDLTLAPVGLSGGAVPGHTDLDAVVGLVSLGPVGEGELLQPGLLGDVDEAGVLSELSLALERDRAVDGRVAQGDQVDIFVTDADGTGLVAEAVLVVDVTDRARAAGFGGVVVTLGFDRSPPPELIDGVRAGEVTVTRRLGAPQ